MNRRLRLFLVRLLMLLALVNSVGLEAARASSDSTDLHVQMAMQDAGVPAQDGSGDHVPGCTHACHLAYHLFAPVSQPRAPGVSVESHVPPAYTPHAGFFIRLKAPLQPPRALA